MIIVRFIYVDYIMKMLNNTICSIQIDLYIFLWVFKFLANHC